MKKVFVLLEDDIEILGNGQGHVFYRQYLPIMRYVKVLKKFHIKATFYVDIAQLLFLRKNAASKDFGLQADYLEKIILNLLEHDMEVQLHLHPQWVNAKMVNNEVQVTDLWNIGQLPEESQVNLVKEAVSCLKTIIAKTNKPNNITSFRAGSWGLQPFETLYKVFEEEGIKTVLGPVKNLKIPALGIDYSDMESDSHPYYCNQLNINKINTKKEIAVVPMTPTYLNWVDLIRFVAHSKLKGFQQKFDTPLDLNLNVLQTKYKDPTAGKDKFNLSFKPYKTHLKMNAQPFWYLKNTFNRAYNTLMKKDQNFKLIVVETHTKDFKNTFNDIEKFFNYITKEYKHIEFITANQLFQFIEEGKCQPLHKKE